MHEFLIIVGSSSVTAAAVWQVATRRGTASLALLRAQAEQEIKRLQSLATRERTRAIQLQRELDRWTEGCLQGRQEIINVLRATQAHDVCVHQPGAEVQVTE
jgi:hypothetical protein